MLRELHWRPEQDSNREHNDQGKRPSVYGVSLIVDSNAKTTSPGVNATYKLTINNSGSTVDNYTLVVSNPDGASVGLTSTQIQKLAPGTNAIILLNVTTRVQELHSGSMLPRTQQVTRTGPQALIPQQQSISRQAALQK